MPEAKEHREVRAEIANAVHWYDERCPGLGDAFVDAVALAVREAMVTPTKYPVRFSDVRRIKLRRFPYSVWFFVEKATIHVVGVLHNKRDHRRILEERQGERN